ncbi:uncharacterized protein ACLA_088780 [Aspergillus clavatus NRRL 1]|uniref:Uncharacterized protein n=1 Tax=Aspergillus clavatus (strain ATCC 1007 / CBS 513.65 / DSM 816 / NCTC 3887 / NRRL 1 / QM 1276 / 107) TaxID=344612 RepID=A1CE89_ASPCL|nr:uncharacterized protein ACLA_088780 [Aspergillus clavatus NRRL 1]EAW11188.1 conserved hypothetical protein [Aspergillus clavatus NRRL 1]
MTSAKPSLPPIRTSAKNIIFPSELRERPAFDRREGGNGPSVPPPRAYTEFLRVLSPVFSDSDGVGASFSRCAYASRRSSTLSIPSSASTSSFTIGTSTASTPRSVPPLSPASVSVPESPRTLAPLRHLGFPPPYSPGMASSCSPCAMRSSFSPSELRLRYTESPRSAREESISIQQIITHTVTLRRAPSLDPPPRGKRRRTNESEER